MDKERVENRAATTPAAVSPKRAGFADSASIRQRRVAGVAPSALRTHRPRQSMPRFCIDRVFNLLLTAMGGCQMRSGLL